MTQAFYDVMSLCLCGHHAGSHRERRGACTLDSRGQGENFCPCTQFTPDTTPCAECGHGKYLHYGYADKPTACHARLASCHCDRYVDPGPQLILPGLIDHKDGKP